ncbi:MAG: peptide chain release factor N(5)-glutamine methyltransferase, partial [Rikenellaceae bacterium]|nr:peptide chain release factor N(5)-glutamine methyltransferase [Rikenellaceae bacterium]
TCTVVSEVYPPEEGRAITFQLFESLLGLRREDIFLLSEAECEPSEAISQAVEQLLHHRPLQYILGETEFYGLPFYVNEKVLIPRPETEELVQWIIHDYKGTSPRILDIGTGNGAIAVSLAKNLPEASVFAVDISSGALETARENARLNQVNVQFTQADILQEHPEGIFDVIVSNPPYVRKTEKSLMRRNVLDHEPDIALFVPDDDPLLFYRRIAELAKSRLNDNGTLYFEINEAFGPQIQELLSALGYTEIEIRSDIFGKDRMAKGTKR